MGRFLEGSTLRLTGRVVRYGSKKERHVVARCIACRELQYLYPSNVRLGKTTNCKCQRGVKYNHDPRAKLLGDRYDALKQRCRNTGTKVQQNYGARGIKNNFKSREHFIKWVMKNLPHETYLGVEIDRIDNDGHYEPGNLRLLTSLENLSNTRRNVRVPLMGMQVCVTHVWHLVKNVNPGFPLGPDRTAKLSKETGDGDVVACITEKARTGKATLQERTVSAKILALYGVRPRSMT
jgi:hypothetical protein